MLGKVFGRWHIARGPRRASGPLPLRDPGAVPELPSSVPVRARGDRRQGQQRKSYRPTDVRTPCEPPKALPEAERYLYAKGISAPRPLRTSTHSWKSPLTSNTGAHFSLEETKDCLSQACVVR